MAEDPRYALALSDAEIARYRMMAEMARADEAAEWDRAGITAGARIVDIGCGPGLMTIELAQIAGTEGRVVGVDREADAVETARALLQERGLGSVEVRVGDAWSTGLDEESFDIVNLRHVLAHNTPPDQARILQHARALLAPGGRAFIVDSDMTGMRIDPPDADLTDLNDRYAEYLSSVGRDPQCGTTLGSLVLGAGFELVERGAAFMLLGPETAAIRLPGWAARDAMIASGHATTDDVDRWDRALTLFAEAGNSTRFVPRYWAIGRNH